MSIVDSIFEHAKASPDRSALICEGLTWTYGRIAERVDALAARLTSALSVGGPLGACRIGLACPDGSDYVLLSLALLRAGACVVPIAGELTEPERRQLIETLGLHGLVIGEGFDWAHPPGRRSVLELNTSYSEHDGLTAGSTSPDAAVRASVCTGLGEANTSALDFPEDELTALEPAFIRFSSGTTGQSKGVVISHRSLAQRIDAANAALRIGPGDRVIWILPMAHHFAVSMMLYLVSGAATVVVGSHLADDVLEAGRQHRGTVLYASPFHHGMLAADQSGKAWPDLRLAVSTAFALSESTAQAFARRFGVPLCQALGVIEAGLPCVNLDQPRAKPTSIGRPTPRFEVQLRDESGRVLPAAEASYLGAPGVAEAGQHGPSEGVGELHIRGPGMFDAYLLPWRPRGAVLDEAGWLSTGDLARVDSDGDLYLVGRTHSVINVGGLKCFPEEVEQVLTAYEGIKAARVYGREHPRFGSLPVAEIVVEDADNPPTQAALTRHCRASLSAYKCPLQFRLVSKLARTASGKIERSTAVSRCDV